MLKKKYVTRAYVEQAYCDKCGTIMRHTGVVYSTCPPLYPFKCVNDFCDGEASYYEYEVPGVIRYEFEGE